MFAKTYMMITCYFCTFFKQLMLMQEAALTHPASKLFKTSFSLDAFVCIPCS